MAILYALVARVSVVLAEFSTTQTNANAIARQILEKIPGTNDSNVSYSQDRYIFHVKRTDGLTILCMADDSAGRQQRSLCRRGGIPEREGAPMDAYYSRPYCPK